MVRVPSERLSATPAAGEHAFRRATARPTASTGYSASSRENTRVVDFDNHAFFQEFHVLPQYKPPPMPILAMRMFERMRLTPLGLVVFTSPYRLSVGQRSRTGALCGVAAVSLASCARAKLYNLFRAEQDALERQRSAGARGVEGGRGKKKTPSTNSCEGFTEPKTRAAHARSTVGQFAAQDPPTTRDCACVWHPSS